MSQTLGEHTRVSLVPPHGFQEICSTFGNIFDYVLSDHTLDPRWQAARLTRIQLPFTLPLSWDRSRVVAQITCHNLVGEVLSAVFEQLRGEGLQKELTSFGGCFAFRPQRTGTKLSAHAWGIAIDLNPENNAQGTAGNMNAEVIAIFQKAGFTWGGDWQGHARDPMHFQFCSGY